MRALAAYSLIDEVGIDTFKAGRFTKTLTLPGLHAGLIFHSWSNDLALRMPQFLAKNNYRNPSDSTKSIAVDHYGMQPWEYFGKNPELGMHFAKWLTVYQMGQGSWLDVFPVEQHLGGVDADKVAFVDVGGSTGSQSLALRKAFSGITGKVVVQDLPHVIETADTAAGADVGVEFQVYDFTTEQPIKGMSIFSFLFLLAKGTWETAVGLTLCARCSLLLPQEHHPRLGRRTSSRHPGPTNRCHGRIFGVDAQRDGHPGQGSIVAVNTARLADDAAVGAGEDRAAVEKTAGESKAAS